MILCTIVQENEEKAKEIAEYLLQEKLAFNSYFESKTQYEMQNLKNVVKLNFVTKALLFSTIEKALKNRFKDIPMIIYSTPVSQVNEEYADLLRQKIKAV